MARLSILIPVYNEEATIGRLLDRVRALDTPGTEKEIIVIDGGSTDRSREILKSQAGIRLILSRRDTGKGSAVKRGLAASSGGIVIIQDADLEYDPRDIPLCMKPILEGRARVVYGSRRLRRENREHSGLLFLIGGILITKATNILFGSSLTDEPTCYKCFDSGLLKSLEIRSDGFEWEPEVTARILRQGIPIVEVPVRYRPRRKGKKIRYRDGFRALWTLLRFRLQ
jgi:dolichol-phosphate mannosyltransferase